MFFFLESTDRQLNRQTGRQTNSYPDVIWEVVFFWKQNLSAQLREVNCMESTFVRPFDFDGNCSSPRELNKEKFIETNFNHLFEQCHWGFFCSARQEFQWLWTPPRVNEDSVFLKIRRTCSVIRTSTDLHTSIQGNKFSLWVQKCDKLCRRLKQSCDSAQLVFLRPDRFSGKRSLFCRITTWLNFTKNVITMQDYLMIEETDQGLTNFGLTCGHQ